MHLESRKQRKSYLSMRSTFRYRSTSRSLRSNTFPAPFERRILDTVIEILSIIRVVVSDHPVPLSLGWHYGLAEGSRSIIPRSSVISGGDPFQK